jgi:DNA repair ATPase RecN
MSLTVLQQAKKYRPVIGFQDICREFVENKKAKANEIKRSLKDLEPCMRKLLDADSIELITEAIEPIFKEIKKLKGNAMKSYTIERAMDLIEAVCRDFDSQVKKVVNVHPVMKVKFDKFKQTHNKISNLKTVWKESIKECCSLLMEMTRNFGTGHKAAGAKAALL